MAQKVYFLNVQKMDLMLFLEGNKGAKFRLITNLFIILTIPVGIPLVSMYRPSYVFDWFSYIFLCLHALFFMLAGHFVYEFFSFSYKHYFSLLPKDALEKLKLYWSWCQIGVIIFAMGFFGEVAFSDWQKYLGNPQAHESTPIDHPAYGSLFSFGPWGWVIFALFVLMDGILSNSILIVFFLFFSKRKFGQDQTTISQDRWMDWSGVFLIYLLWVTLFTLPFSVSNAFLLTAFYSLILAGPTFAYLSFLFLVKTLQFRNPKGIEELAEIKKQEFNVKKLQVLLRNTGLISSLVTLGIIIHRYFSTSNHVFDNPILFIILGILVIGWSFFDYWSTQIEEKDLGELTQVHESNGKISTKELHMIMAFKLSHYYILCFLENHSPSDMKELKRGYPNSFSNLRTSIEFLAAKGCLEKIPHLGKMNKKMIQISPYGLEILKKMRTYLHSIS